MNERIRKLAEQAGFYYTDKTGFITPAGCNPAKFAQLIVQECMKVSNRSLSKYELPSDKIAEHFGVEE